MSKQITIDETPGKVAYNTYTSCFESGGLPWEDLPHPRKAAWEAAAHAVIQEACPEPHTDYGLRPTYTPGLRRGYQSRRCHGNQVLR